VIESPEAEILKVAFGGLLTFSIVAVTVIDLSLVRITQNPVGFLNLLESLLSRLIPRIDIGMVFTRQPPIRLPDLGLGYVPVNIQQLIVIVLHDPPLLLVIHVDILGIDHLVIFGCCAGSLL
jgi:hypothetical protein